VRLPRVVFVSLAFEKRVRVSAQRFTTFDFGFGARDLALRMGDILFQLFDRQGLDVDFVETVFHTLKCGFQIIFHTHRAPPCRTERLIVVHEVWRA